jgi:hypothetical protein
VDGGIYQGEGAVTVVCDVFEDPDTSVELMQLPLDYERQDQTAQALLDRLAARPDVKAVEALDTVETANMPRFCRMVSEAPEHIVMFGGGALNPESDFKDVLVFSSAGPTTDHGIVFVLYAGENFHAQTRLVQGWKPLGMPFRITRAERMTLYELNDRPALEIYNHYLHITERDNFLENGLCFPFVVTYGDEQVLRTPIGANECEGSIELPTDVTDVRGDCRIAYGDPISIRESVRESVGKMQDFRHHTAVFPHRAADTDLVAFLPGRRQRQKAQIAPQINNAPPDPHPGNGLKRFVDGAGDLVDVEEYLAAVSFCDSRDHGGFSFAFVFFGQ